MALVSEHHDNIRFYVKVREYHCSIYLYFRCVFPLCALQCRQIQNVLRHFRIDVLFIIYTL